MKQVSFILNNVPVTVKADPGLRLVDLLRESFGLCGTKEACGQGECGACTVLLNDQAVHACLTLVTDIDGCRVVTIEGLGQEGAMDVVQEAFVDAGAIQCGYCTPGMIMSAKALLMRNPHPSLDDIKEALEGNICRCTGYTKIIEAVLLAAERSETC